MSGNNNDNRSRHLCGDYHLQGLDLRLLNLVVMKHSVFMEGAIRIPIEQRGKQRHREVKRFAVVPTSSKWQKWDLNLGVWP